jgi:hypothetical protein
MHNSGDSVDDFVDKANFRNVEMMRRREMSNGRRFVDTLICPSLAANHFLPQQRLDASDPEV